MKSGGCDVGGVVLAREGTVRRDEWNQLDRLFEVWDRQKWYDFVIA